MRAVVGATLVCLAAWLLVPLALFAGVTFALVAALAVLADAVLGTTLPRPE